ncbi:hypothetical protein CEXT_612561 [Caerostris extrusa]|uniref:Uncharacterized protein n=1 Tax=Caerostris extrusa TaxID=172846 RepID=A0AAV4V5Y0_CAEEX|nr:hypothetical protein CEXT_612561 [Caerostris extrusa]
MADFRAVSCKRIWFQHDESSHISAAMYGSTSKGLKMIGYPYRWIGRGEPFTWPLQSFNLDALVGNLKSLVYETTIIPIIDLALRIMEAVAHVPDTLSQFELVRQSILQRYEARILYEFSTSSMLLCFVSPSYTRLSCFC